MSQPPRTDPKTDPRSFDAVQLAAQADLVLLTVQMLRPPSLAGASPPDWTALDPGQCTPLLRAAQLPESAAPEAPSLAAALDEAIHGAANLSPDSWSDEYWRLFDSSTACPINQASYIRRDKGAILGDVAGFYAAFGWRHDTARGQRPDHLLCQLEFVAVLLAMAARADQPAHREVTLDALAQFARLHLHDWLPSFGWQLCHATQLPYFAAVAAWLLVLWDALTAAHQWPVDPYPEEHLEPSAETESPYECAAQGLVQITEHY
jgi:TorA maturation chaperone TorD